MNNQNDKPKAIFENGIWIPAYKSQSEARIQGQRQNDNLMCACGSNVKCDGICRELHLYRPRMANPTAKKNAGVSKSWADKCPSVHEKP